MQHSFWVFDTEILEIITSLFTVFLHICRKSLQDNLPHHLFYHQYLPTTIFHHHWPLIWIIQRKFLLPRKSLFLGFFCNSFSNSFCLVLISSVFATIFSWQALTVFKEACATAGCFSLEPLLTAAIRLLLLIPGSLLCLLLLLSFLSVL